MDSETVPDRLRSRWRACAAFFHFAATLSGFVRHSRLMERQLATCRHWRFTFLFGEICRRIRQSSLLEARTVMWQHVAGEQKSAEAVVACSATSGDAKG